MSQDATNIQANVAEEGRRLAVAASANGLSLRLIGGVGIWVQCPSARLHPLARSYGDVDFVGRSRERKAITEFLEGEGYEADKLFNAMHGASRLNLHDPLRDRPLDVLLDQFKMAHELDLRESTSGDGLTVSLADLLLTKLQVVDLNRKDLLDLVAILLDHDLAEGDIEIQRVLNVTHNDWGFEHTIHGNLDRIVTMIEETGLSEDNADVVRGRAARLGELLRGAPKGARWKLRARVGERVRWYEEPEEARG